MTINNHYYFADVYGVGTFGGCDYNTSQNCAESTGGATTNSGTASSGLANTGVAVLAFASLACLIIAAAIVVRVWHRKSKSQPTQSVSGQ